MSPSGIHREEKDPSATTQDRLGKVVLGVWLYLNNSEIYTLKALGGPEDITVLMLLKNILTSPSYTHHRFCVPSSRVQFLPSLFYFFAYQLTY